MQWNQKHCIASCISRPVFCLDYVPFWAISIYQKKEMLIAFVNRILPTAKKQKHL